MHNPFQLDVLFNSLSFKLLAGCVLSLLSSSVLAFSCSPASISLHSQAEVNDFQSNHGNGGICDRVTGTLNIQGADITDLSPLGDLALIANLNIRDTVNLKSIDGLSDLQIIINNFVVRDNAALDDFSEFDDLLDSPTGQIYISNNSALSSLDGFSSFTRTPRGFFIGYNSSLRSIDGLRNISGHLISHLQIWDNAELKNLDGLEGILSTESLEIFNNEDLEDVDGLSGVTDISSSLLIHNNPSLTNIDGLSNVLAIGWALSIAEVPVTELSSLSELTGGLSGGLIIRDNPVLENLAGLEGITGPVHSISISDNVALKNIDGLGNIQGALAGSLRIRNNPLLADITGLSGLDFVSEILSIFGNASLSSLDGLEAIEGVVEDLSIRNNQALTHCLALKVLFDGMDDFEPGPGPGVHNIPDIGGNAEVLFNQVGCNSIGEAQGLDHQPRISMVIRPNPLELSSTPSPSSFVSAQFSIENIGDNNSVLSGSCELIDSSPELTISDADFHLTNAQFPQQENLQCDRSKAGKFTGTLSCDHNGVNLESPLTFPVDCTIAPESESETGPYVPCANCGERSTRPLPTSGPWADTDLDGSGFLFRVQDKIIAGWYFGYSEGGDSDWLLFNGQLNPGQLPEVLWKVEAPLQRFTGGSCPHCDYLPPQDINESGSIEVEFLQRNYARFRINGGPDHYFNPLHFGAGGQAWFEGETPYVLPNPGPAEQQFHPWIFVYSDPELRGPTEIFHLSAFSETDVEGGKRVVATSQELAQPDGFDIPVVRVICGTNDGESQTGCVISIQDNETFTEYRFPLGNLGAHRITAENDSGNTLDAIRLGFE